jgi:hypothetical protein
VDRGLSDGEHDPVACTAAALRVSQQTSPAVSSLRSPTNGSWLLQTVPPIDV